MRRRFFAVLAIALAVAGPADAEGGAVAPRPQHSRRRDRRGDTYEDVAAGDHEPQRHHPSHDRGQDQRQTAVGQRAEQSAGISVRDGQASERDGSDHGAADEAATPEVLGHLTLSAASGFNGEIDRGQVGADTDRQHAAAQ